MQTITNGLFDYKRKRNIISLICFVIFLLTVFYFYTFWQQKSLINNMQYDCSSYYVDFDESMQLNSYVHMLAHEQMDYIYRFFKTRYQQYDFRHIIVQSQPLIPKIIHVMWLGGQLPEVYEPYVGSWRKYHPQWQHIFWTDNPINFNRGKVVVNSFESLQNALHDKNNLHIVVDVRNLSFDNKVFYDQAINYGERSDILKWEIVYRFGGTYVDTDFECLKPLDIFHHSYDFYTGIQPLDTNIVQLGAALYGARPGHPVLAQCVNGIKNNQHIKQIVIKTGPIHFTKSFLACAGTNSLKDIAMPASYFYPCSYEQRGMEKQVWNKKESFAIHHWAGSWLKPEAFVK